MKKDSALIQGSIVSTELKSGAEVFGLDVRCEDWILFFNASNRIDSNCTARANPQIIIFHMHNKSHNSKKQ